MQMLREKHWLDRGVLYHGCTYCYLKWRKIRLKKEKENDDSDDIL